MSGGSKTAPLSKAEWDMRNRIERVIASFVDHRDLPANWPGTVVIANAVMDVVRSKLHD